MMDASKYAAINRLMADYAHHLDQRRLNEWVEFFTDDASYEVIPKENVDQGLPAALILCEDRDALKDRLDSLNGIIKYNIHTSRHILSTSRIEREDEDGVFVQTNFSVYQTCQEGVTRLFCCGSYEDQVVFVNDQAAGRCAHIVIQRDDFDVIR